MLPGSATFRCIKQEAHFSSAKVLGNQHSPLYTLFRLAGARGEESAFPYHPHGIDYAIKSHHMA